MDCWIVRVGNVDVVGRLRSSNVLEVEYGVDAVKSGVLKALNDSDFLKQVQQCENPFGTKPCADIICDYLSNHSH